MIDKETMEKITLISSQFDVLYKQYFLCFELFNDDPFTQDVICSTLRRAMDDMLDLLWKEVPNGRNKKIKTY